MLLDPTSAMSCARKLGIATGLGYGLAGWQMNAIGCEWIAEDETNLILCSLYLPRPVVQGWPCSDTNRPSRSASTSDAVPTRHSSSPSLAARSSDSSSACESCIKVRVSLGATEPGPGSGLAHVWLRLDWLSPRTVRPTSERSRAERVREQVDQAGRVGLSSDGQRR